MWREKNRSEKPEYEYYVIRRRSGNITTHHRIYWLHFLLTSSLQAQKVWNMTRDVTGLMLRAACSNHRIWTEINETINMLIFVFFSSMPFNTIWARYRLIFILHCFSLYIVCVSNRYRSTRNTWKYFWFFTSRKLSTTCWLFFFYPFEENAITHPIKRYELHVYRFQFLC